MPFIKSGKTTIVFLPSGESWEAAVAGCGCLVFWATIICIVTAPIWGPFYFIQNHFEYLINQWSYDGWIIDPITQLILLSIAFIIFATIYCFVIVPAIIITFDFCIYLFKKVKIKILQLFREPITGNQRQRKPLIKARFLIRWLIGVWILSLLILPLVAFQTQIGLQYFLGTLTRSYAENVQFHGFEQNPFDQLKLLDLEKKYSLNLNSEDRQFMLDITGRKYKKFLINGSSLSWDFDNETIYTNLGLRSGIILFYEELEKFENKYHVTINMPKKLLLLHLSKEIAKGHRKTEDEVISDKDLFKFLEYSFILGIAENKAEKQTIGFTAEELKLFGKLKPNKFQLPRFARNQAIELTKLWQHNLSNEQKKASYEDYCSVVVNSIYRAYTFESGYSPSENDSKMIKSEAKNPKGDSDFNACRKFLINKGYQFDNNSFYKL